MLTWLLIWTPYAYMQNVLAAYVDNDDMAAYVDDGVATYVDDGVATNVNDDIVANVKWTTLWTKSSAHFISIETISTHQKCSSQFNPLQPNNHFSPKENQIQNSQYKISKKKLIMIVSNPIDHFKLFIQGHKQI
jgi:hypothetical protein